MNGMFNNNFVMGMLLARDLPQEDQLLTGLAAGQMPANSPIGPILLKPGIDKQVKAESERATATAEATALRQPLLIELPPGVSTITLRVPDAAAAKLSRVEATSSTGTTVDGTTGAVALPTEGAKATVAIALDGVVREVTVVRAVTPVSRAGDGPADRSGMTDREVTPPEGPGNVATGPRGPRRGEAGPADMAAKPPGPS